MSRAHTRLYVLVKRPAESHRKTFADARRYSYDRPFSSGWQLEAFSFGASTRTFESFRHGRNSRARDLRPFKFTRMTSVFWVKSVRENRLLTTSFASSAFARTLRDASFALFETTENGRHRRPEEPGSWFSMRFPSYHGDYGAQDSSKANVRICCSCHMRATAI